jgi:hypothetical protein
VKIRKVELCLYDEPGLRRTTRKNRRIVQHLRRHFARPLVITRQNGTAGLLKAEA